MLLRRQLASRGHAARICARSSPAGVLTIAAMKTLFPTEKGVISQHLINESFKTVLRESKGCSG